VKSVGKIRESRAREPKCLRSGCLARLHTEIALSARGCASPCAPPEPPPGDPRERILGALQRYGARVDERRSSR
jgi:hypothetical protein